MSEAHRIEVVEYDPAWPERFAQERDVLNETIAPYLAGPIEHVGSTAVPGLCAKPVIDIMIPVHDLTHSRPAIALLERHHGYTHAPYKEDVMHWLCKPGEFERTHHVHMIAVSSELFRERLLFRDALRADAELRERYAALKWRLALEHPNDREAYTEAKGPFVRGVLDLARGR